MNCLKAYWSDPDKESSQIFSAENKIVVCLIFSSGPLAQDLAVLALARICVFVNWRLLSCKSGIIYIFFFGEFGLYTAYFF